MNAVPDVVVVGAGAAGLAAALAARRAGAAVLVLESAAGGTALAPGAWDVAPVLHPDELFRPRHPLAERIRAVARARSAHPYAVLDDPVARVAEAHEAVLPVLGGYRPLDLDGPGVLAVSELGLPRRVATCQQEVLAADPASDVPLGVVDPGGYPGWDAAFVAASITEAAGAAGSPLRATAVRAPVLDPAADAVRHPHELAAMADGDRGRQRLVDALRSAAGTADVGSLLLPPLLGVATDAGEAVRRALGRGVGEALGALATPQALRLDRRLRAALERAGADVRYAPVGRVRGDGPAVRVELAEGSTVSAAAVVLATGKHLGGGLAVSGGDVREPLADLPLRRDGDLGPLPSSLDGPDPVEQFGTDWWAGGVGFSLGVGYDAELRALGRRGERAVEGLFVAGALLDGFDPARDGTGLGCCVTTGFVAGGGAAAHAGSLG
ncbi:MAG: FAD-binding protein [Myxococcota bacterium]